MNSSAVAMLKHANNPSYAERRARVERFISTLTCKPYGLLWQFTDQKQNTICMVDTLDAMLKHPCAFIWLKKSQMYKLVSFMVPEWINNMRFTNDPSREVNIIKLIVEKFLPDEVEVIASTYHGGRFSYPKEGKYHDFMFGNVALARIYIEPVGGGIRTVHRDATYYVVFPSQSWYKPNPADEPDICYNGFMPFAQALVPRLHYIRHRAAVEKHGLHSL